MDHILQNKFTSRTRSPAARGWATEEKVIVEHRRERNTRKGNYIKKLYNSIMLRLETWFFWQCGFKGTVPWDFLLLVFFMGQFPPSPRVSHLGNFKFFRKLSEIFASQGAPPRVSTTPVAICHQYQRHRRQILPLVWLVMLISVENL